MSSSNSPSQTIVPEPSAAMAAQLLRDRIGQENVAQSSVLASRRLDEALLRFERASDGNRITTSQAACSSEQAQTVERSELPNESAAPAPRARTETALDDPAAQTNEMSTDAIESLFGKPIDVMVLSTKAKISEDRVFKPSVTPDARQPTGRTEPATREHSTPEAEPTPTPATPAPVSESHNDDKPVSESPIDFIAAWQVDEFILPSTIDQLFLADSMAEQLAGRLAEAGADGLRTIAITSVTPGEGRSTVAMGLALSIAFSGLRVALIDADRNGVKIASDLQLDLDHSWPEAIRSSLPLEEIAVASQADALTLLPLLDREGGADFESAELNQVLMRLRQSFDMIVVDCGAAAIDEIILCGTALIVRDEQRTEVSEVETLSQTLCRRGVHGVGVIENFCD